jgi:hypothetical protein
MEAINQARLRVGSQQPADFFSDFLGLVNLASAEAEVELESIQPWDSRVDPFVAESGGQVFVRLSQVILRRSIIPRVVRIETFPRRPGSC